MKKSLFGLSLTLVILALISIGPDTPADDPGQAAQEPPATTEAPEAEAGEPLAGEPLETFEPTEKLSADSAVSFPVDI